MPRGCSNYIQENQVYDFLVGVHAKYDHLREFGCRAFVHIPKDERSKLDVKAKPCVFSGYGHEEFGYKLRDPMSMKIVKSRDAVFLEDQLVEGNETRVCFPS